MKAGAVVLAGALFAVSGDAVGVEEAGVHLVAASAEYADSVLAANQGRVFKTDVSWYVNGVCLVPPYTFSWVYEKAYLNGEEIFPNPRPARGKMPGDELTTRKVALCLRVNEVVLSDLDLSTKRDSILAVYRRDPVVQSAWISPRGIEIRYVDGWRTTRELDDTPIEPGRRLPPSTPAQEVFGLIRELEIAARTGRMLFFRPGATRPTSVSAASAGKARAQIQEYLRTGEYAQGPLCRSEIELVVESRN